MQVSRTWHRAKGKASGSYAYGPTFPFDYGKVNQEDPALNEVKREIRKNRYALETVRE